MIKNKSKNATSSIKQTVSSLLTKKVDEDKWKTMGISSAEAYNRFQEKFDLN